jgi:hypothetical protein
MQFAAVQEPGYGQFEACLLVLSIASPMPVPRGSAPIAHDSARECQPDPRIPGGRFDNHATGTDAAIGLHGHCDRDPVLDARNRVEEFELG